MSAAVLDPIMLVFKLERSMSSFNIYGAPGHLLRRAQQIVVSLFLDQTEGRITPIQFGVLAILEMYGEMDQVRLASRLALDESTSSSTLRRMEAKGLISREQDPADRRRRIVQLTQDGRELFDELRDDAETVQYRLLESLEPKERAVFMRLLAKLVQSNNHTSRAPLGEEQTLDSD